MSTDTTATHRSKPTGHPVATLEHRTNVHPVPQDDCSECLPGACVCGQHLCRDAVAHRLETWSCETTWREVARCRMKPRALELFGGEGLAALGWAQAGFDVTLVENDPERIANAVQHSNIRVVEGDATTYPLGGFDVVTGGPPCTDHTETAALAEATRGGTAGTGWMLPHTLDRLRAWATATGGLWVVENVEGAREHFTNPVKLCGTTFGLHDEGWWLQRHRYFESNVPLMAPGPCRHAGKRFISVHGDLAVNDRACGGKRRPGGDMRAGVERARRLMGAPWASPRGLSLGIPPAYTRFLGEQLMAHLESRVAA